MKSGKLGFFLLLLFLNSSACSAWFGSNKHKSSYANGRNSILPHETSSSSSSSSSYLSRFRSGSSVLLPVHGNVYPVGYVNRTLFTLSSFFFLMFHFIPFFLCCFHHTFFSMVCAFENPTNEFE